jgi:hypothetical protein
MVLNQNSLVVVSSNKSSASQNSVPQMKKPKKISTPYVIVWVCHYGPESHSPRDHGWSSHEPRIFGVYNSKAEAEAKKNQIMRDHDEGGYSDIRVGDDYSDEIDLLIRPVEEYFYDGSEDEDEDDSEENC